MIFNRPERVVYQRNPLAEVICQVRFPDVLELQAGLPIAFQKKIGDEYPDLTQTVTRLVDGGKGSGDQGLVQGRTFHFWTEDRRWQVSCSSGFLALSAQASYERWEEFLVRWKRALEVFITCYEPKITSRIGLRYKDLIVRSALGLNECQWEELIEPHLINCFFWPSLNSGSFVGGESKVVHQFNDFSLSVGVSFMSNADSSEDALLLDADFYIDQRARLDASNINDKLGMLNREAGGFFRSSITDRLHEALQPKPA